MKKYYLIFAAVLLLLAGASFLIFRWLNRPKAFVSHWAEIFEEHSDLESLLKFKSDQEPDLIVLRVFENEEWVAGVMEHACCTGAGFNAIVFYDSAGEIYYDTEYTICGYESFDGYIRRVPAKSLEEFYAGLKELKLQRWR